MTGTRYLEAVSTRLFHRPLPDALEKPNRAAPQPSTLPPGAAPPAALNPPVKDASVAPTVSPSEPTPAVQPVPPTVAVATPKPIVKAEPDISISDDAVAAYMNRRLDPQMAWYSAKASRCKRLHYCLVGGQVAATTSIPLFNMLTIKSPSFAYFSTIAAAVAGLSAGWSALGKYKEHWVRYRETATTLENLKIEFELSLVPFHGADRNSKLVAAVQKILSEEQTHWQTEIKAAAGLPSGAPGLYAGAIKPAPSLQNSKGSDDGDDN